MLESLSARLRPRSVWEGLDLGMVLASRHFPALMKLWFLTVVPLWILLCLLLHDHPFWACTLIWWLRPLYDRIPLHYLSRVLFGEKPTIREVLRNVPQIATRGLFQALTFRRCSPWRSFNMPILLLENSTGRAYVQRSQSLLRHGSGASLLLTGACWLFELCLTLGVGQALFTMVPGGLFPEATAFAESWNVFDLFNMELPLVWTVLGIWLLVHTIVEQFFVAGGFCLYLNSRAHMEGWDIEISFRSLSERLKGLGGACIVAAALIFSTATADARSASYASPAPGLSESTTFEEPKDAIRRVKSGADFEIHKETIEVIDYEKMEAEAKAKRSSSSSSSSSSAPGSGSGSSSGSGWKFPSFSGFEGLGTLVFWGLIGLAACLLVWMAWRNREAFKFRGKGKLTTEGPRTVMGMNVAPEALPKNLVETAQEMWERGDFHGALRLLYCGAISYMIDRARLPVVESDTEGDCLRHSTQLTDQAQKGYFHALTSTWVSAAYAKTAPDDSAMRQLFASWPFPNLRPS